MCAPSPPLQELIGKELRSHRDAGLPSAFDIRVSTIDGFDLTATEYILLSTVRSNTRGGTGLAGAGRTVVAALSRARAGLIIVGSAATLRSGSRAWAKVLGVMETSGAEGEAAVGEWLPLTGVRSETGRPALARTAADFMGVEPERRRG
jgi:hypothetical protein